MSNKAFTLIEIIIVITIVALIAAAIFVSVDPGKRLGDARDAIRASNAIAIEKAIQKAIAEEAAIPSTMAALTEDTPYMIVTNGGDDTGTCNCNTLDEQINRINIAGDFEKYLGTSLPVDPEATADDSGYYITRKGNSFYIESCNAYGDEFVASCDGYEANGYCWYASGSGQSCDTACASHGGCVAEDWNDDASCTILSALLGGCNTCAEASSSRDPSQFWAGPACYYRAAAVSQDCSASQLNTARICACNN